MTDRIILDRIRLRCRIGISQEERREPQEVILGLTLILALASAGKTEDLADTVNYREALERVTKFVTEGEFILLEGLAEGIASLALDAFRVQRVKVRVRKAKYSNEPRIGIEIERERGP